MALARRAGCACAVAAALLAGSAAPAPAAGGHISILSPGGRVTRHALAPAARATLPEPGAGARIPRARASARRTVRSELTRLARSGQITAADRDARRAAYDDARGALHRLSGTRRAQLQAVIGTLDSIAARGQLTASRLAPLWLTLARNVEWWTTAPYLPASGERVGFDGDELVYQYYPGQGLQIQWLGTFGKLNALAKSTKAASAAESSTMIDQILPLASARAGGIAWEYEFAFGGGAAPWTSSLSQGTGLQALARAAVQTGRQAEVFAATRKGLAIFRRATPAGVRVKVPGGTHYAQYSFAPGLRILNGFVQSVVGLHDYAELTGNTRAQKLYDTGNREAQREVPAYDTGAWSLYSRGTSTHESSLSYHLLLRDFLVSMCDRTALDVYCGTAQRFTDDVVTPPVVRIPAQRLARGRYGYVRMHLDKISSLTLRITRAGVPVTARSVGTLAYGTHRLGWSVPERRGRYTVTIGARDLAGNPSTASGTVRVVKRG
jgi:Spy/CpxP family protein refolding chaperone